MLDKNGFNGWATDYDGFVDASESAGTYPFCGYKRVHARVAELLKNKSSVLDLGVGTARLTSELYGCGMKITGVDFSENMLEVARRKMPNAKLILADLTKGFPTELNGESVDAAMSLYAIHHFTDEQKREIIDGAFALMGDGGIFVIGDVAFGTEKDRAECRASSGGAFDDEEHYCVFETFKRILPYKTEFERISFCAGVITITRR